MHLYINTLFFIYIPTPIHSYIYLFPNLDSLIYPILNILMHLSFYFSIYQFIHMLIFLYIHSSIFPFLHLLVNLVVISYLRTAFYLWTVYTGVKGVKEVIIPQLLAHDHLRLFFIFLREHSMRLIEICHVTCPVTWYPKGPKTFLYETSTVLLGISVSAN